MERDVLPKRVCSQLYLWPVACGLRMCGVQACSVQRAACGPEGPWVACLWPGSHGLWPGSHGLWPLAWRPRGPASLLPASPVTSPALPAALANLAGPGRAALLWPCGLVGLETLWPPAACGLWSVARGLWAPVARSSWPAAHCLWPLACGPSRMAYGMSIKAARVYGLAVSGPWPIAHSPWSVASGTSCILVMAY